MGDSNCLQINSSDALTMTLMESHSRFLRGVKLVFCDCHSRVVYLRLVCLRLLKENTHLKRRVAH